MKIREKSESLFVGEGKLSLSMREKKHKEIME